MRCGKIASECDESRHSSDLCQLVWSAQSLLQGLAFPCCDALVPSIDPLWGIGGNHMPQIASNRAPICL